LKCFDYLQTALLGAKEVSAAGLVNKIAGTVGAIRAGCCFLRHKKVGREFIPIYHIFLRELPNNG